MTKQGEWFARDEMLALAIGGTCGYAAAKDWGLFSLETLALFAYSLVLMFACRAVLNAAHRWVMRRITR